MPEALNFFSLDHRVVGDNVIIQAVKYRGGKRHIVNLHLRWMPQWQCWMLQRYEERPARPRE